MINMDEGERRSTIPFIVMPAPLCSTYHTAGRANAATRTQHKSKDGRTESPTNDPIGDDDWVTSSPKVAEYMTYIPLLLNLPASLLKEGTVQQEHFS